jgi:hypothetical protein
MKGKTLIDLNGKTFGLWKVKCRGKNDRFGKPTWVCVCECGTEKEVNSQNLRKGSSTCCGCVKPGNTLHPYEALFNQFKVNVKQHRSSIEVNLTYEQFLEFTKEKHCSYCGGSLYWTEYDLTKNGGAYNLDRKNNSLGYTKDNCTVCCGDCNKVKSNRFTYEQMLQIGALIKTWRT